MRLPKGPDIKFRLPKGGPSLKLPKGPSFKRPSFKAPEKPAFLEKVDVPPVVADLFRDMRDRHLLPLVAVAAAALVAVPLLLSNSAPELTETQGSAGIPVVGSGPPPELTVVADRSGLRDYRRRLDHLEKKNPFVQHFSSPVLSGSELGGTAGGSSSTTPTTESPEVFSGTTPDSDPYPVDVQTYDGQDPTSVPPSDGSGGSGGAVNGDTDYVSYEIDVRIVRPESGKGSRRERVSVRRGVSELEMLPREKSPVVLFMGVSADREKALFLVSEHVTAVFGDVKCMMGSESCQLVMLEPGLPVTFVYGARDKRLRLNVLRIDRVTQERP